MFFQALDGTVSSLSKNVAFDTELTLSLDGGFSSINQSSLASSTVRMEHVAVTVDSVITVLKVGISI